MNIVSNLLDRYAGTDTDNRLAIKYESEEGKVENYTYAALRAQVSASAIRMLFFMP